MTAVREYCPVGDLTGNRHTYVAGTGVIVPWDVAGDPRPGVEICRTCHRSDGWLWRRGWQHHGVAAIYGDNGIRCATCDASITYDDANVRMIE